MTQEFTGVIETILSVQSGEGRNGTWKKQELIVRNIEFKKHRMCFLCWNEVIPKLEKLKKGDVVEIEYLLDSREYDGKWYTQATLQTITLLTSRADHQFENLFSQLENIAGVAKSLITPEMNYDSRSAASELINYLNQIIPDTGLPEEKQKMLLDSFNDISLTMQKKEE